MAVGKRKGQWSSRRGKYNTTYYSQPLKITSTTKFRTTCLRCGKVFKKAYAKCLECGGPTITRRG